jgi:hypothetical protein
MDVYTTSFTYPRRSRHTHSPASSLDFQGAELRTPTDSYSAAQHLQHVHNNFSESTAPSDNETVQKLAMMAMTLHGCHVSFLVADHGRGWNFHITGAYQQVMIARGMILKECPIQVTSFTLLTTVASLTGAPNLATVSGQGDALRNP